MEGRARGGGGEVPSEILQTAWVGVRQVWFHVLNSFYLGKQGGGGWFSSGTTTDRALRSSPVCPGVKAFVQFWCPAVAERCLEIGACAVRCRLACSS